MGKSLYFRVFVVLPAALFCLYCGNTVYAHESSGSGIERVSPTQCVGGTLVEVHGHGFADEVSVEIGGIDRGVHETISPELLILEIPELSPAEHRHSGNDCVMLGLRIRNLPNGDVMELADALRYRFGSDNDAVRPVIEQVEPDSGPQGTVVRVLGANFDEKMTVFFGMWRAEQTDFVSSEEITAVVPRIPWFMGPIGGMMNCIMGPCDEPRDKMVLDVTVVNLRTGEWGWLNDGFVYEPDSSDPEPAVLGVVPAAGRPGIEALVRVEGFGESVAVYFGECKAEVLDRPSLDEIVVRVPEPCQPHITDNSIDVPPETAMCMPVYGFQVPVTVVDLDTDERATLDHGFVYVNAQEAAVLDVAPDSGPAGMLTTLTVRGIGEAAAVYFDDTRADIVERTSLDEIVVAVPELELDPTMGYDAAKGDPLACNDDEPGNPDGPIYRRPVRVAVVDLDTGVRAVWQRVFLYMAEQEHPPVMVVNVKPSKGYPGMLATVLVKGFGEAVAVYFGGNEASVVDRPSLGEIVVEVPPRDSAVPVVAEEPYEENGVQSDEWWRNGWWGVPVPVTVYDLDSGANATKQRAFKYVFEPAVALLAIRNTDVEPKAEDVMVPVVLDYHGTSAEGISVLVFAISFDTNIVTVRDVVLGESAQSAGKNIQMYLGDDGLIRVAVSGGTSVIEQGVVCLLDISLDIGSRRGMGTKLRFEEVSASSPDGYELQLDTRPGVIRVGRSYDCNSDGAVDAIDIQHVINFALKAATGLDDIAAEIADGDLDGDIDAVDIQMVINKTLGL